MSQSGILGIDLFKICWREHCWWIPSWKMGAKTHTTAFVA